MKNGAMNEAVEVRNEKLNLIYSESRDAVKSLNQKLTALNCEMASTIG